MKVFIQSIVAQLLLNPYIFWRGYQAIPAKKSWRIPYTLFFILELAIYFFGFLTQGIAGSYNDHDPIYLQHLVYCFRLYHAFIADAGSAQTIRPFLPLVSPMADTTLETG